MGFSTYKHVLLEQKGKILYVTMNRPEQLNAFVPELEYDVIGAIEEADRSDEIEVVVLTGAGRAFSAGGDIAHMQESIQDFGVFEKSIKTGKRLLSGLLDCDKPIIVKMNGDAIGLGATVALFCDIIVADESARIADPHIRVGLVAGDGGAIIWPALIGYARAKRYLLTGEMVPAREAEAMGLIAHAVPAEQLDAKVDEIASRIANGASKAVKWTKTVVNLGLKERLNALVDAGFTYEAMSSRTSDHAEAVTAFLEKRKPVFTGK